MKEETTSLNSSNVSVILVEPSHPGNIGATARAMNNMGITDLRLVSPTDHLQSDAYKMASNSSHILENATIFDSLRDAIHDKQLVIGTSARLRTSQHVATSIVELPDIVKRYGSDVSIAIIFGRERTGLTNSEMNHCNEWVYIPTFGESSSLNLAQAVIVTLYEVSKLFTEKSPIKQNAYQLASAETIEGLKDHFLHTLGLIRFFGDRNRDILWNSFSNLIGRAKPDERDVRIIRGFFNKIEVALGKKKRRKKSLN